MVGRAAWNGERMNNDTIPMIRFLQNETRTINSMIKSIYYEKINIIYLFKLFINKNW